MIEAKENVEAVRMQFLAEINKWCFPSSDWETEVVLEISQIPSVKVLRCSEMQLMLMGTQPRQAHKNALLLEASDPEKHTKLVTGWWQQDGIYIHHSVVRLNGQLACVTPAPMFPQNPFDFIPDQKIGWRESGNIRKAYRNGCKIGLGVRADPEKVIADMERFRERLLSGMDPQKAMQH